MKRKLEISKRTILLFFLFLILLRPSSIRNFDYGISDYVLNITYLTLAVFITYQIVRKKLIISGMPVMVIIYFVVLIMCTMVKRTLTIEYFTILFKMILTITTVYFFWQDNTERCLEGLEGALAFYLTINFIGVITHPDGLYVYHYVQEGLTYFSNAQFDAQWIFGQKNSFIPYITLLLLVTSIRYIMFKNKMTDKKYWTYYVISILSVVLVKSDTSILALGVYLLFILFFPFFRKHPSINTNTISIGAIIINVLLIGGNTQLFGNLIFNITGKSASLSNRDIIWQRALLLISSKPVFGYGYIDSGVQHTLLGNAYFNSTHNMALQVLFYGGILLMAVFATMTIMLNRSIIRNKNYNLSFMITATLLAIFVEGLAESLVTGIPVFLSFLVMLLASTDDISARKGNVKNMISEKLDI